MSETLKDSLDPLTMPAVEFTLSIPFGSTEPTPQDRLDIEILNLNHAMELLQARAINGFECLMTYGGAATSQYRVRRWSENGFQLKEVHALGKEGSGCYGLFDDPQARRLVELVHEHAFGRPHVHPSALNEMVAKFQAI